MRVLCEDRNVMLSDREDMVIVEYKNFLRVKATFKNVDSVDVKNGHVVLLRFTKNLTEVITVAILRLGLGEYVEVVNELAGS